jgi:glucose-1-phosphatase
MTAKTRPAPWLFLDLGNVVVDVDKKRASALFSSLTKLPHDEFDWIFFGSGLLDDFNLGRISENNFILRVQGDLKFRGATLTEEQVRQVWASMLVPLEDTIEWLLDIEPELAGIWVVSDINPLHWHAVRGWLLESGITRLTGATLSYELGVTKPNATIFEDALERSGAPPSDVLFVDDRVINTEGAERLGITGLPFVGASHARTIADPWLKVRR